MPDWKQIVRERLNSAGLPPSTENDVITELAAHLEDIYEEGIEGGMSTSNAARDALAGIHWPRLAGKIERAKSDSRESGRDTMNQRTRKLWLPALGGIMFTAVLLVVLDKIHAGPLAVRLGHLAMALQLAWFVAMPLFGRTAPEVALMNSRTRTMWLPGFVTLTAASLFLFAEEMVLVHDPSFYLTGICLQPDHLIVSRAAFCFYLGWLLTQVLCGALGAYLSRRGGGSRLARVIAGTFPALVIFGLCALVIPVSALFERNSYVLHHPAGLAFAIFLWAGAPGVALLAGASPFLQGTGPTLRPAV